ncbi:hypothetical protein IGI04_036876 [Brassica rapa subsp. trilocularis]|uniref:Uncharacterized protein n=1 Tax=Brassica rapa subsp. trilocularis TaxID=1813537 RepID=A0ABQ7LHY2_BRACM|nr:hypothetical protein IGI04_036876 [Brassica rapa subsp. trilocularis]
MDLLDGFSAPPSSTDASPPCTNLSLTSDLVAAPLPTSSPQFPPSSSPELPVSTPSTVPEGPNGTVPCVSDCVNGTGPHGSDVVTCDNQSPPDTGATASASHDSGISATMEKLLRFVPSLGSWAKPLYFKPSATPPEPSTPSGYDPAIVGIQLAVIEAATELKADGTLRFPWAARLSPQSRNLYRVATPTYRLDGTPEVYIPSKVLRLGPGNKDEYIIGKFHRCSLPPGGLVHAVQREKDTSSSADIYLNNPLINGASLTAVSAHDIPLLHQMKELNVPSVVSAAEISQSLQSDLEVAPPLFTVSSDVSVDCQSTSNNTLSPLVDSQSTPITAAIMDSVPSNIINKEVQTPSIVDILTTSLQVSEFESPSRFTVLEEVDEVESEHMSSLSLTRGGRETKPPIKFQNLEWKTMQGKGKRGRCGRGSSH